RASGLGRLEFRSPAHTTRCHRELSPARRLRPSARQWGDSMRWKEKLYERRLKRPLDDSTRIAITDEFQRRQHLIPGGADLEWSDTAPELTIRSRWISFLVEFHDKSMIVTAELSLAAKLLATDENRRRAVEFVDDLMDELNL